MIRICYLVECDRCGGTLRVPHSNTAEHAVERAVNKFGFIVRDCGHGAVYHYCSEKCQQIAIEAEHE